MFTHAQRAQFVDVGVTGVIVAGLVLAIGRFISYIGFAGSLGVGGHFAWWSTWVASLLLIGMAGMSSEESPLARSALVIAAIVLLLLTPEGFSAVF